MRRLLVVLAALLMLTACNPLLDAQAATQLGAFRSSNGASVLVRDSILDRKAEWQAARMAHRKMIFHSQDLKVGVPTGWTVIGENVGSGGSVEAIEAALEVSPPHRTNLLDPRFKRYGVATVVRDGVTYLVQVFVG